MTNVSRPRNHLCTPEGARTFPLEGEGREALLARRASAREARSASRRRSDKRGLRLLCEVSL
jgi:hypothetical protein